MFRPTKSRGPPKDISEVANRRTFCGRRDTLLKKGWEISAMHLDVEVQVIVRYDNVCYAFQSESWTEVTDDEACNLLNDIFFIYYF